MAKYHAIPRKRPQGNAVALYKRLLSYGRPFLGIFVIAIIANLAYSGIDALYVYSLKPLLDVGFYAKNSTFLKLVPFIAVGLFLLRSVANLGGNYAMSYVGRSVVMRFRQEIFNQFLRLPCSFYDKSSSGHLLSMVVYNASQVADASTDALVTVAQSGFFVIGLLVVMFSISWQLSLIFFVTAPFLAVIMKISSKRLKSLNRGVQEGVGDISHVAEEAIEGYRVVRTFGGEDYESKKFNKAILKNLKRELKVVITKSLSSSSVQIVGVIVLAIMIMVGTSNMGHKALTPGAFIALISSMMALLKPMKDLTKVNATIQRGLAGAESIFELIDEPAERDTGTLELDRVHGDIIYKDVGFSYNQSNGNVLENISFTVSSGKTIAFVGRSGSGKSTLVNLLPRFYDHDTGTITIDGNDVNDIKLSSLRQQFALVTQHVTLFNDTIANNIAYGRLGDDVTDADIEQAAKAAHAMEFIQELPEGLHTLIGENGVLLSGGQRQRIAIARAILKDAPILILDEATSALDTESERHIQAALEEVMRNRTTLVIAHRLSTIENADQIVVLDKGHIVETGTHSELLAKEGHYAKLHRLQFKDPRAAIVNPLGEAG
ncbi:MAG: lipid A export permease/ATP-binding protein MsbA [Legionellales bacterium]|nr:lipid A export permease/ATP-binding protein MsbA [Legionellales bacterium]|tara:strand:- start:37424 stop:39235 length:1812 start_codon:yes stop_codon:yes gene_type:complete